MNSEGILRNHKNEPVRARPEARLTLLEFYASRTLYAFLRPYGLLFRERDRNGHAVRRLHDRVAALATSFL